MSSVVVVVYNVGFLLLLAILIVVTVGADSLREMSGSTKRAAILLRSLGLVGGSILAVMATGFVFTWVYHSVDPTSGGAGWVFCIPTLPVGAAVGYWVGNRIFRAIYGSVLTAHDTGWTEPRPEAGPVPLTSTELPLTRIVRTRITVAVGEEKEVLWDEGKGARTPHQRIKPLVKAVPAELKSRLQRSDEERSRCRIELDDQRFHEAKGVVVSLNPDVLIVTLREWRRPGASPFDRDWDKAFCEASPRGLLVRGRIERLGWFKTVIDFSAGTLVPWGEEMYAISTDPNVPFQLLKFEHDQATVALPKGKLILQRRDSDVEVTRE
jgi:hypothetical protein